MDAGCLSHHPAGVLLRVRAMPNASRSEAAGLLADETGGARLQVRLKAPPVEGKANAALCAWAAECFGVRGARVTLLRGGKSREKDLLIEGMALEQAQALLDRVLKPAGKTKNAETKKDDEDV